jgi:hypothetical protein
MRKEIQTIRSMHRPITLVLFFAAALMAAAPSWFVNMADNTWKAVAGGAGQTLDAVKPVSPGGNGQNGIIGAWSGGCVDQTRGELILAANGGHSDYYGNEVYACAVRSETPSWERLTDPTPASLLGSGYGAANLDGLPRSMHTYNGACFVGGKVWYASTSDASPLAASSGQMWSFDRDKAGNGPFPVAYSSVVSNNLWVNRGNSGAGGLIEGNGAVWDRNHNKIWSFGNSTPPLYSVNLSTLAVTNYNRSASAQWGGTAGAMAYGLTGATTDLLAVFNHDYSGSSPYVWLIDLNNPTGGLVQKTLSTTMRVGSGCVYHQASRSFYIYEKANGANIFRVQIPANPLTDSWANAWSTVTPAAGNTVTPQNSTGAGTYSKFNIIEDMGNGQSALVVILGTTLPIYVYKLPGTGNAAEQTPPKSILSAGRFGKSNAIYDLTGRRVLRPEHSGVYLYATKQGFGKKIFLR